MSTVCTGVAGLCRVSCAEVPQRILVVDDNAQLVRPLVRLLRRRNYEVEHALSCAAARQIRGSFDLAVLDLDLPDGSGIELHQELARGDRVSSVIFYTGTVNDELLLRASRIGPCVRKSEGVRPLLECIHAMLGCETRLAAQRGPAKPDSA